MRVLLGGLGLFAVAFLGHLVLWRVRPPKREIRAELRLFFGTLALGLLLLPRLAGFGAWRPGEALHLAVFATAVILAYIVTATTLQVDSPSLAIVQAVAAAGEGGLSREELGARLPDSLLVLPRLEDLVRDQVVVLEGGIYRLRRRGSLWIDLMIAWRRLMRQPVRGG